jgi:hypothetical protein
MQVYLWLECEEYGQGHSHQEKVQKKPGHDFGK